MRSAMRRAGLQLGSGLFKPDESTTSSSFTEGTISRDLFRYKLVRSSSYVELTVNGDEMEGDGGLGHLSAAERFSRSPVSDDGSSWCRARG